MEERNIKVSFEKAKEWYNSNNPTLKELALQAFKEKELARPTYSEIYSMTLKEEIAFTDIEKMLRVLAFFYRKSEGCRKSFSQGGLVRDPVTIFQIQRADEPAEADPADGFV